MERTRYSRLWMRPARVKAVENAKVESQKPFPHEEELKTKSARLAELNTLLDMDKKDNEIVDSERSEEAEEPDRADSRDAR